MSVTLADLRRLLEGALKHTDAPAILRLPEAERTVEGVARAYLPREVFAFIGDDGAFTHTPSGVCMSPSPRVLRREMDLSDPGTAHALLVTLALGMGLDPGVGGLDCSWCRDAGEGYARWILRCAPVPEPRADRVLFDGQREADDDSLISVRVVAAPTVALEPDPIRALELAVRHVLKAA